MATNTANISVEINVKNNAKADLQKFSADAKKAADSLDTTTKAAGKTSSSFLDLAKGVFAGQFAYQGISGAIQAVTGFFKDSIEESTKAQEQMARVKTNVENAGFSYDEINPKLKAYSEAMIKMGFDDETTSESVSKLLLVTKDYSQAVQLNQLAMDLARNKNISLEQATSSLAMVMQGAGARALMQYGLSFKDGASAAEILNELQGKVKNSAEAFANTTAGKLAAVKEEWANMKQEVGDSLQPVLAHLFQEFEKHLPEVEEMLKVVVKGIEALVPVLIKVADSVTVIGQGLAGFSGVVKGGIQEGLATVTDKADMVTTAFDKITGSTKGASLGFGDMTRGLKVMADENFKNAIDRGGDASKTFKDLFDSTDKVAKASDEASKKIDGVASSFSNIGTKGKAAKQATEEQKKSVSELGSAYDDVTQKISKFTFDASTDFAKFTSLLSNTKGKNQDFINDAKQGFDAFSTKVKKAQDDIQGLKDKLQSAQASFNDFLKNTKSDSSSNFAQIIFDAEKAIPDLQKKLAEAQKNGSSSEEIAAIQKEITDKQGVLTSANQDIYKNDKQLQDDLALMRSNATKNELDAAQATMQDKIAKKTAEYNSEVEQINKLIADKEAEKTAYLAAQEAMTNAFKLNVEARKKQVLNEKANLADLKTSVDSLKSAYDALAAAQSKTIGGQATATASGLKITGKATGGPVSGGTPYIIGEKGPEMFVPAGSGTIIPNDKMGGVTININNPSVRNDNDIALITSSITRTLARQEELARSGAYK